MFFRQLNGSKIKKFEDVIYFIYFFSDSNIFMNCLYFLHLNFLTIFSDSTIIMNHKIFLKRDMCHGKK